MSTLIKQGQIAENPWFTFTPAEGEAPETCALPQANQPVFSLQVWQAQKAAILARFTHIGLQLEPHEPLEAILEDLPHFQLIAIHFPKFVDGRGYSLARLLRERHHYSGELRAVGDVLQDQIFFMSRVGFDAFLLREDQPAERVLAALKPYSVTYQTGVDQPLPLFRRRQA